MSLMNRDPSRRSQETALLRPSHPPSRGQAAARPLSTLIAGVLIDNRWISVPLIARDTRRRAVTLADDRPAKGKRERERKKEERGKKKKKRERKKKKKEKKKKVRPN